MAESPKRRRAKDESPRRKGGVLSFLVRLVICGILSVLILYLGLQVMSRTDGFKYLITEQIGPEMGVPTSLGKARFDAMLNLHLEGLICREPDKLVAPSLYVKNLRVEWDWRGLLDRRRPAMKAVFLEELDLTLAEDLDQVWRPKRLRLLPRIAESFDEKDIRGSLRTALLEVPEGDLEDEQNGPPFFDVPITIQGGSVGWIRQDGEAWAEINHFNLSLSPEEEKGSRFMHCRFDCGQLITPKDIGLASLEAEFMYSGKGLIMLGYKAPLPQYNASSFRRASLVYSNQVVNVANGQLPPASPEPGTGPPGQPAVPPSGEQGSKLLQFTPEELDKYINSVINE